MKGRKCNDLNYNLSCEIKTFKIHTTHRRKHCLKEFLGF